MQGLHFVLMFTALTFLSWGAYGPLLRYGTTAMGHDGLKAFVGVGLAYFVIAVIVPFWILSKVGEKGKWTFVGTTYSIIAGSVGAIGALGIILALVFKGNPVYVMPLVFGFAPIVNTLVTSWMGGTLHNIRPIFIGGIIAAALGAGGVLVFKPSPQAVAKPPAVDTLNTPDATEPEKSMTPKESTERKSTEPASTDKPLALNSQRNESPKAETSSSESNKPESNKPESKNAATPSTSTSAAVEPKSIEVEPKPTAEPKTIPPETIPAVKVALLPDVSEAPAPDRKAPAKDPVAASVVAAPALTTLSMPDAAAAPEPEPRAKPAPTDVRTSAIASAAIASAAMPEAAEAPAPEAKQSTKQPTVDISEPPPVPDPTPASLDPIAHEKQAAEKQAGDKQAVEKQAPVKQPATETAAAPKDQPVEQPAVEKPAQEKPTDATSKEPKAELPEEQPAPAPERPALPPLAARSTTARVYLTMQRDARSDRSTLEYEDVAETSQPAAPAEVHAADAHAAAAESKPNYLMIALSIAMAAVCWGSYGPMLHKGQMKMGGSRLRPFACVGIAYFIIAVAAPLLLLYTTPTISHGSWSGLGLFWSIIAGGAGALGALGIILAFNSGGKPIYVMPLVFGFAPVINTFISLTEANAWSRVQPMFWVSLAVVIAGAITVLITAPKAHHGPASAAPMPSPR